MNGIGPRHSPSSPQVVIGNRNGTITVVDTSSMGTLANQLPALEDHDAIRNSVHRHIRRYPDSTIPAIAHAVRVPLAHVVLAVQALKVSKLVKRTPYKELV